MDDLRPFTAPGHDHGRGLLGPCDPALIPLVAEVTTLESLLPICAYCRMIRDTKGKWHALSRYIADRTETEFSHAICPPCFRRHVDPMLGEGGEHGFRA